MRRKDKEIDERAVIEEILREQEVGRLGTSVENVPYVVPINFVYTQGKIIFHSHREGKKLSNISKNPNVCFEVDVYEKKDGDKPCDYTYKYRSVIVKGRAEFIEDHVKRLSALRRLTEKYAPGKGIMVKDEDMEKNKHLALVEIHILEMTGKRSPKPSSA